MGYHNKYIERGKFGEFSKIREEFLEAEDAFRKPETTKPASIAVSGYTPYQSMMIFRKNCEGFEKLPYLDVNVYAIGFGTRLGATKSESFSAAKKIWAKYHIPEWKGVILARNAKLRHKESVGITFQGANSMMVGWLNKNIGEADSLPPQFQTQNCRMAWMSFVYTVGGQGARETKLYRAICNNESAKKIRSLWLNTKCPRESHKRSRMFESQLFLDGEANNIVEASSKELKQKIEARL